LRFQGVRGLERRRLRILKALESEVEEEAGVFLLKALVERPAGGVLFVSSNFFSVIDSPLPFINFLLNTFNNEHHI
jgi:hypothetical protein